MWPKQGRAHLTVCDISLKVWPKQWRSMHAVMLGSAGGCSPAHVVGVVRAADRVEVQLLEQRDVLEHALLCQGLAPALVVLVPADSLDQNWLVVDQQIVVLHLTPLEADLRRNRCKAIAN